MHFSWQPVNFRVALIVLVIIQFELYCFPEGRFGDKKELANTAGCGEYLRLVKEREHCSIIRQNDTFCKFEVCYASGETKEMTAFEHRHSALCWLKHFHSQFSTITYQHAECHSQQLWEYADG